MIRCKENFRRIRLSRALSMRDLATASGVTPFTICRAENGRPLKPQTARKLCAALDAEFDALFEVAGNGGSEE